MDYSCKECKSRRDFLRSGFFGVGIGMGMPFVFEHTASAMAAEAFYDEKQANDRILVVVEMAGGNDGLNTVVPFANDAYYKARPTLALKKGDTLPINDEVGLHSRMISMKRIWDDGKLAIVQGCGYPNPNRSHFTSMEYWHTAMPNKAESFGWVGRFADSRWPGRKETTIVNIAQRQSLAVQAGTHAPVVFSDPKRYVRAGNPAQEPVYREFLDAHQDANKTVSFVREISKTAQSSSALVRDAVASYRTPVSYGSESNVAPLSGDLKKVAALINAGFPARVYYVSMGGFDTHGAQLNSQATLLMYVSDAIEGFLKDMKRLGRNKDVAMMMFTEFGRRVEQNQSGGTDHGSATPMYLIGDQVKGGLYGKYPSLTDLDDNGDLKMNTDFRTVYATMIQKWMGYQDTKSILRGDFIALPAFA